MYQRCPKDLEELKRFLKQEWAKMTDDFVAKYVLSMPNRIKLVEAAKGLGTKY